MVRTSNRLAAAALAAASITLAAAARAQEGSPADLLKERGLKRVGSLHVLPAEAEVQKKLGEVRRRSTALREALARRSQVTDPEVHRETIRQLNDDINDLSAVIREYDKRIGAIPRFATRYSRFNFENSGDAELFATLQAERQQYADMRFEKQQLRSRLTNRPPNGRERDRADAEVQRRREAYRQAADELKGLVESTRSEYESLAKDAEVAQAIAAVSRGARRKLTLGPSRDFRAAVEVVERLEAERDTEGLKSIDPQIGSGGRPKGTAKARRARG